MKYIAFLLTILFISSNANIANSARFANKIAEFAGMDKITGRILTFDVEVNKSVQFGYLTIKPMVCYSRDDNDSQRVDAFVSINESLADHTVRSIFSGWMFADSPAMNAIDHSIYDVWLIRCKDPIITNDSNSKSVEKSPIYLNSNNSQDDSNHSLDKVDNNSKNGTPSQKMDDNTNSINSKN
ncbi:DUF2155 domain-containing protein [Candidatus Liberibacter brunswickensis]|uniref:DUF2155 domain-containing protein n=1 Tax=Candidatus Liberibacter brunswickensis TaxID=1968796 RepID=UPI002FE36F26